MAGLEAYGENKMDRSVWKNWERKVAEWFGGDAVNAKLDREIREQMKDINLDELTDTEDLSPEVRDILNKVKKMKGEMDDERKEDWR